MFRMEMRDARETRRKKRKDLDEHGFYDFIGFSI